MGKHAYEQDLTDWPYNLKWTLADMSKFETMAQSGCLLNSIAKAGFVSVPEMRDLLQRNNIELRKGCDL